MKDRLKELRIKNGYSQKDLANKLYVKQQTVSKWESTNTSPDLDLIVKLSKLYNVTTDYIVTGSETTSNVDLSLINVYSFQATEQDVLKYRRLRTIGALVGLISAMVFIIIEFALTYEVDLFVTIIVILFFFSLRSAMITNNANFDVPENRYNEALMDKRTIHMILIDNVFPILLIIYFIMNLGNMGIGQFFIHYYLLILGYAIAGIIMRQYRLFSKNKVLKEQKTLMSCKEVIFNKKYNIFDIVGRIICCTLLLASIFLPIITM